LRESNEEEGAKLRNCN